MKILKGFVRQSENPKGSTPKGYIVYESFYHTSEYIKQIDETPGEVVWDDQQDENKREGELLPNEQNKAHDKELVIYILSVLYRVIVYSEIDNIF